MNLSLPVLWWLAAGLLVAGELLTGTFYLLMLALGCAAGALVAHAGLGTTASVVVAAAAGSTATVIWHLRQGRRPRPDARHSADVNLDIGQTLQVPAWGPDGRARCSYRGAQWTVRHQGTGTPAPGLHTIVAVEGSELLVAPAPA